MTVPDDIDNIEDFLEETYGLADINYLDEVWPEDLTRWAETQYNDLLMRGRITQKIQNS